MPKDKLLLAYDNEDGCWYPAYEYELGENQQTKEEIPLKDLADFCDSQAESRNNGAYVGAHRILAALLFHTVGLEKATQIIREIAEYGGLDGMGGVGGTSSAFTDFGIADCWADWDLIPKEEKV